MVLAGAVNNPPNVLAVAFREDFKVDDIGPNDLILDAGADNHVEENIELLLS